MPQYQNAQRISVYLSMPSGEISTSGIVHDAFSKGKQVFVPFTYQLSEPQKECPPSIMDMVNLRDLGDYESLTSDRWGIPTPNESSIAGRSNSFGGNGRSEGRMNADKSASGGLDLIVMPGMAFDARMNRLGHGKGFYDFFLERTKRHANANDTKMPFLGACKGDSLYSDLLTLN